MTWTPCDKQHATPQEARECVAERHRQRMLENGDAIIADAEKLLQQLVAHQHDLSRQRQREPGDEFGS